MAAGRAFAYRLAAPFYDLAMARVLAQARRDSIASLNLGPGQRLLLPGIGTGLDLPWLPRNVDIVGGDLVPAMLRRAASRSRALGLARLRLMSLDAQALPFAEGSFDAVLLHLIVAVAPDGRAVLREAARVIRPGGRLAILDKFISPEVRGVPLWRRGAQLLMNPLTDFNRCFETLMEGLPLRVLTDHGVMLGRTFRRILLERT